MFDFRSSKKATIVSLLALSTMFSITSTSPAAAQTEYWKVKKRAESRQLTSAALNFLNSRFTAKAKKKGLTHLDNAILLLNKAIAADDTDPRPHYILGLALGIQGKYEQSLDMLRKAYKLDPREHEILLATGIAQYLNGHYDKAITLWEQLAQETKNNPAPIHALIGYAYMRSADFENAVQQFRKAKELAPDSQVAYQGLAILNYLAGDLVQSRQSAEHAQTLGPYPLLSLLIARIDYLEGNEVAAAKRLKDYKRQSGKKYIPRSMLSLGFGQEHDFHFDPFEREIYDSPEAMLARNINNPKKEKTRQALLKRGKVAELLTQARRLASSNQSDFVAFHEIGLLQLSSAEYQGAGNSFQSALSLCPNCRVDYLYLGDAFSKANDKDRAKKCVQFYQKTYPSQPLAARYQTIATTPDTTPQGQPAAQTPANQPLLPGEGPPTDQGQAQQDPQSPF